MTGYTREELLAAHEQPILAAMAVSLLVFFLA